MTALPRPADDLVPRDIAEVVVVVPARDEEECLPRCLAAVAAAAEHVSVPVRVVVVLDRCTDASEAAARAAGVDVVTTDVGAAGAARALGVTHGLSTSSADPCVTWVACTDADSVVPPTWLLAQLAFADAGADCVVGTVEPVDLPGHLETTWRREHRLVEGHDHIHGANLGIRASAYLDVGGFAALALHEDADLVDRLRTSGHACVATDTTRVTTSGRRTSRVDGGFASYLSALLADGRPPAAGPVELAGGAVENTPRSRLCPGSRRRAEQTP